MLGNGKNTIDSNTMLNQNTPSMQHNFDSTPRVMIEAPQENCNPVITLQLDSGVDITRPFVAKPEVENKQESLEEEYEKWDLKAVLTWLEDNDFGEYKQNFAENDIHGKTFFELTHKALKNLNIPTITERVRLLNATKKIGLHRTRKDRRDSFQINTETLIESDHEPSLLSDVPSDLEDQQSEEILVSTTLHQHPHRNPPREGYQTYRESRNPNLDSNQYPPHLPHDNPTTSREPAHAHGHRDIYATYRDYQNINRDSFTTEGHPALQAPVIRPRGSSKDYFQNSTLNLTAVSPVSALTAQSGAATIAITPRSSSRNIRFFSSSPGSSFDTHNQSPVSITDTNSTVSEYPSIPPRGESLGHWRSKNSPVTATFPSVPTMSPSIISSATITTSPVRENSPSSTYFLGWTSKTHKKAKSCPDDLIPPQKILRVRQENSPVVQTMCVLELETPQLLHERIFQRLNITENLEDYLIYACRQGSSVGKPIDEQELFELCEEAEAVDPIELVVCRSSNESYEENEHANDVRYLFQAPQQIAQEESVYLDGAIYEDPQEIPDEDCVPTTYREKFESDPSRSQSITNIECKEDTYPLPDVTPSRKNSARPKLRHRATSFESIKQAAKSKEATPTPTPNLTPNNTTDAGHSDLWSKPPSPESAALQDDSDGDLLFRVAPTRTNTQSPHNGTVFGERPSADHISRNLDFYFPNHDLDQPIIEAVSETSDQEAGKKIGLVHKKTIRGIVQEARRNSVCNGLPLRRKSTKLWDSKVSEVPRTRGVKRRNVQVATDENNQPILLDRTNTQPWVTASKIQWVKGSLIGKGSFGKVYHALNAVTGEMIAVKQVDVPNMYQSVRQQKAVATLYAEIDLLKNLEHENIVQYLGFEVTENTINIFLEYVPGGTISSALAIHGALPVNVIKSFVKQTLLALEHLHERKILHRDIKGANILVDTDGVCKISDFGISKKNDDRIAYASDSRMSLQGSVFWMAPEVIKNNGYSAKVDIWSLGCLLIEMWSGHRPWLEFNEIATMWKLGTMQGPPYPENLTDDARDFLDKCLTIDPDERPTASELLAHPFCQLDENFKFSDFYTIDPNFSPSTNTKTNWTSISPEPNSISRTKEEVQQESENGNGNAVCV
ncbi:mitogen-activated protein kinase kinase kinase [Basidiobolus ranarum]|uniref:Mitogen-activated protein kinase kinase kinase n=1 Tax=Basidiobolus ranarum TaxID=34480 RepID=A0ABR2X0K2_9FUNG